MICPKCGSGRCRYNQRRENFMKKEGERFQRTDFTAKCKECGWEGEIK